MCGYGRKGDPENIYFVRPACHGDWVEYNSPDATL